MGKTAPLKQKGSASVHSRAAKRATSPGIDLDKSLKDAKPPVDTKNSRPSVLAVHQGAGVSKKSKHGRKSTLSAKAKRRQERGLDRAEAVMDRTEKKVEKSKVRSRIVQERSKAWEELNKKILEKKAREDALEKAMELLQEEKNDASAEDGDGMQEDINLEDAPTNVPRTAFLPAETIGQFIPLPEHTEDEEEIL